MSTQGPQEEQQPPALQPVQPTRVEVGGSWRNALNCPHTLLKRSQRDPFSLQDPSDDENPYGGHGQEASARGGEEDELLDEMAARHRQSMSAAAHARSMHEGVQRLKPSHVAGRVAWGLLGLAMALTMVMIIGLEEESAQRSS